MENKKINFQTQFQIEWTVINCRNKSEDKTFVNYQNLDFIFKAEQIFVNGNGRRKSLDHNQSLNKLDLVGLSIRWNSKQAKIWHLNVTEMIMIGRLSRNLWSLEIHFLNLQRSLFTPGVIAQSAVSDYLAMENINQIEFE